MVPHLGTGRRTSIGDHLRRCRSAHHPRATRQAVPRAMNPRRRRPELLEPRHDLARGIYPPLLSNRGVVVARRSATRRPALLDGTICL
jgi:hypothetical protein